MKKEKAREFGRLLRDHYSEKVKWEEVLLFIDTYFIAREDIKEIAKPLYKDVNYQQGGNWQEDESYNSALKDLKTALL